MKTLKSIFALFLVLTLLSTLFHIPLEAAASNHAPAADGSVPTHPSYFKVVRDTEITDAEQERALGLLKQDAYLRFKKMDQERIYFQWGQTLAYVPKEDVEIIDWDEQNDTAWVEDDVGAKGWILVQDDVEISEPESGDLVAVFYGGTSYPYVDKDERSYRIVLGNRLLNIEKTDLLKEHDLSGEPEETTEKEQGPKPNESTKEKISPSFAQQDRFFEVVEDRVAVYDNSSGSLVKMGELLQGEVYPRIRQYGNWHEIQFGDRKGYVWQGATRPADGSVLKDLNNGRFTPSGRHFVTLQDAIVYDNKASDTLTPFAVIQAGVRYPILSDYGGWWRVDVAGRIGYVLKSLVKLDFNPTDRFFTVIAENAPVYENRSGALVKVGELYQGQVYPRIRDYGNWHEIKFGKGKAYVHKGATQPVFSHNLKNINTGQSPSSVEFSVIQKAVVYDNTSGQLVPFASLEQGQTYPIISSYGAWWRIDVSGRIGYIHKNATEILPRLVVNPRQTYTYEQMIIDIGFLEAMYPALIETRIIGKSVDGRNLYAVKLGTGPTEILINAAHHAREHMTTNLVMKMLDEYAYAYHAGKSIGGYNVQTVLDRTSIWFVPMVNPDGVTLVQKGHRSAKNPSLVLALNKNSTNFSGWKANIRGVDLNRQYPALWNTITADPGRAAPENYKGPKPLSEPESRALYNFTLSRNIQAAIAYHSSGELIYTRLDIEPLTRPLANSVAAKTGYKIVNLRQSLSGGGFTDWFILEQRKPALTLEISPFVGPRPVPLSYWDRIWAQNDAVGLLVADKIYQKLNEAKK